MKKKLSLLLVSTLLVACQQMSTTQGGAVGANRQQTMTTLLSEQQVDQMASKSYSDALSQAKKRGALNSDAAMTSRVRLIARHLINQTSVFRADAARWNWEVNVETNPELNAYCMAGGKIMVYSGIIQKLQLSDDELAQIIGHEISHALREHTRERMSEAYARAMGFSLVSAATGGKYDGYLDVANQVSTVAITLPNSREHESEADMMGLELAARAGYNPNAAVSLWQKMASAGGSQPPQFLSTHPSNSTRIQDLQAKIPVVMPLYESAKHKPVRK